MSRVLLCVGLQMGPRGFEPRTNGDISRYGPSKICFLQALHELEQGYVNADGLSSACAFGFCVERCGCMVFTVFFWFLFSIL